MKPTITYSDFAKLDIKIATIKSAERVEKSDKLLKLLVDIGEPNLVTLVSGIGLTYEPDDLIDKQIPILANLTPRSLMGIQSQGMILALGEENDKIVLLHPNKPVKEGGGVS